MSDIQHDPDCNVNNLRNIGDNECTCKVPIEQRLRDEIERLKAAIKKHKEGLCRNAFTCTDLDNELYEVLEQEPTDEPTA